MKFKPFTMIEMLTVVCIIGVLMAFTMPSISKGREMAMRAACTSNLRQIGIAWANYSTSNKGAWPYVDSMTTLYNQAGLTKEEIGALEVIKVGGNEQYTDTSPGVWGLHKIGNPGGRMAACVGGSEGRGMEVLLAPYLNLPEETKWAKVFRCPAGAPFRDIAIDPDKPSPWTTRYTNSSDADRDCGFYEGMHFLYFCAQYNRRGYLNVNYPSAPARAPLQFCSSYRSSTFRARQATWVYPGLPDWIEADDPNSPSEENGYYVFTRHSIGFQYSFTSWHFQRKDRTIAPRPTLFLDGHVRVFTDIGKAGHLYDSHYTGYGGQGCYGVPSLVPDGIYSSLFPRELCGLAAGLRSNFNAFHTGFCGAQDQSTYEHPEDFGWRYWQRMKQKSTEVILDDY